MSGLIRKAKKKKKKIKTQTQEFENKEEWLRILNCQFKVS